MTPKTKAACSQSMGERIGPQLDEIKPESSGQAALSCSLCPACAPPAPSASLLGTARSWRGSVPFTHSRGRGV